ncbi:hypothetical protein ACP70R_022415 [Stipagrostis hirtigluma subsp. patula]
MHSAQVSVDWRHSKKRLVFPEATPSTMPPRMCLPTSTTSTRRT